MIRSIAVRGNERLEPETVRAYANLRPGGTYTAASLDTALKDLYATELFTDVVITGAETGNLVITVRENPVINRIVLEGNKKLKSDKILPEIKLAPRQIFTRSKVRSDVERIVELYRREGRFAAQVEPKIVQLDQNRVDLVFEIFEGDKSKVRSINIIGNNEFSDDRLRKEMFTREAGGLLGFLRSNDSYDPDRLAADQQKLRSYYLTQGYADFRVVSALAELTPDRRDFIITYVVEEGPRYKFGKIEAESALRDLNAAGVKAAVNLKPGDWFNAEAVENAVTNLTSLAGLYGYAFADIDPAYQRDAEKREMNITFRVGDTPRVYVERIEIQGNTVTHDKVIRREFRLNEGDAFNAIKVKRSQDRLQSLGFFQDSLEIKQSEGSGPDRVVLAVDVEEKATGELSLSGGYSSTEGPVVQVGVAQKNFRGMGQGAEVSANLSKYSKSASLRLSDPYAFDKQMSLGGHVYRQDSQNYYSDDDGNRVENYRQIITGFTVTSGLPVTEFMNAGLRYTLSNSNLTMSETFYSDPDGSGPLSPTCDPDLAGATLCDEEGTRLTSAVGYSLVFSNTNSVRPTRGHQVVLSQDFAGLGGDVRYIRTRADVTKYWEVSAGWVLSGHIEGGYIHPLQKSPSVGQDAIRLSDRFFGPQLRGFDVRGIGPRTQRTYYNDEGELDSSTVVHGDALGGRAYYMGRAELEIPTSAGMRSIGLRPSAFVDVGSVWQLTSPIAVDIVAACTPTSGTSYTIGQGQSCLDGETRTNGYKQVLVGNSPKPRLSIGIGVNWVSPFGPFRLDIAKALLKQDGDDTKLFSFNVGTSF